MLGTMQYISTFPVGFETVVQKYMTTTKRGDYHIDQLESGFVQYTSSVPQSKLFKRPLFSTTLAVILTLGKTNELKQVRSKMTPLLKSIVLPKDITVRSFKLLVLNENTPTALADDKTIRYMLGKQLRLEHVSHHPDCELILMRRSNGQTYLLLRTYHVASKNQKGELSENIASLLCYTAGVQKNEIVLDPFAGHGSIPFACAAYFNPKKVIALEKDELLANKLRSLLPEKCVAHQQDIMSINEENELYLPHTIDRIVTDPPWGIYEESANIASLYVSFAKLCDNALRKFGTATILTAQPKVLLDSFADYRRFKEKNNFNVLVSGKKAAVITLQKK